MWKWIHRILFTGVCHADELLHLFPIEFSDTPSMQNKADQTVSELLTDLWVNFAKTGYVAILQVCVDGSFNCKKIIAIQRPS